MANPKFEAGAPIGVDTISSPDLDPKIQTLYMIHNRASNGIYIGQTCRPLAKRSIQHRCELKAGRHKNAYLQASYNKHGAGVFEFSELETHPCLEDADEAERFFISYFRFLGYKLYNLKSGGWGRSTPFPEVRKKLSLALKGRRQTPEHRKAVSVARTGWKASEITRKKMSAIMLARGPMPLETRAKISRTQIGIKRGPMAEETKRKIAAANTGKIPHNKGKPNSPEIRLKISLAVKKALQYANR